MIDIKKIYLDLKEAKPEQRQWRDVWVLESESFKDPITLQIEYTDKYKAEMTHINDLVNRFYHEGDILMRWLDDKKWELEQTIARYKEELNKKDEIISKLQLELVNSEREKVQVLQKANELKKDIEMAWRQIDSLAKIVEKIGQTAYRQTRAFNGQTFVSGNWTSALTAIKVPDGNYVVQWATKIVEKNEFVQNEDVEVGAFNLHVTDGIFTPEYELKGTTELDTPTATVNRTFTLIPN